MENDCRFPFHSGILDLSPMCQPMEAGSFWWSFSVFAPGSLLAGQMRDHMRAELSIAALTMAIHKQKPHNGLIHHSDPRQPRHRGKVPQAH